MYTYTHTVALPCGWMDNDRRDFADHNFIRKFRALFSVRISSKGHLFSMEICKLIRH